MARTAEGPGWFVEVTPLPLTAQHYIDKVVDPAAGAVSSFIGTTRNTFQGKAVLRLDYEAYVPMAIAKLQVSPKQACLQQQCSSRLEHASNFHASKACSHHTVLHDQAYWDSSSASTSVFYRTPPWTSPAGVVSSGPEEVEPHKSCNGAPHRCG